MTRSKKKKTNIMMNANNKSPRLLITKYKSEIIEKVKNNKVVIIVGQTGCGKSTQVPQYLHENRKNIGVTPESVITCLHPRSVAAMSLGIRVAEENGTRLAETVGYRVRFYTKCNKQTKIVYMTAGFMLRLLSTPAEIESYGVVIIDEAHQRTTQIDLIMGQMQLFMAKYSNLRLVIMSATMNLSEIKKYYPHAAMVEIDPVKDNVTILYRSVNGSDYVTSVCDVVLEILHSTDCGHVLVFLPSEDKVWRCKKLLSEAKAIVLPFYGAMDFSDKMAVFKNYRKRKVIVATNIAETSLTIDGIMFVVDSGYVKRVIYDHDNRVERWVTERVSIAEAEQRKGRTGRTGNGKGMCYRLFDKFSYKEELQGRLGPWLSDLEVAYSLPQLRIIAENVASITDISDGYIRVCEQIDELLAKIKPKKDAVYHRYPVPEILITNLESTVLTMMANNIRIQTFPFVVTPSKESVSKAVEHLKMLSLLQDDGSLTPLGLYVAQLPLDPAMGKVAVIASKLICNYDVLIIIALLSSSSLLKRPSQNSHRVHQNFFHEDGDLMLHLNIWEQAEAHNFSQEWCKDNGISFSSLKFARLIFNQLCFFLIRPPFDWSRHHLIPIEDRVYEAKKAFLSGFFENLATSIGKNRHQTIDKKVGLVYQYSCVPKTQKYVMPLSNHSSQSRDPKEVIMKQCTVYDEQLLMSINPKFWRIRSNVWQDIVQFLVNPRNKR